MQCQQPKMDKKNKLICKMVKNIIVLLLLFPCLVFAQKEWVNPTSEIAVHPRLLLPVDSVKALQLNLSSDTFLMRIHNDLIEACNKIIQSPLLERNQIGRRILHTSDECLRRVYFLSYAFRMTGNIQFAQRAEAELLNVCGFKDWNPSHFLDVADMTLGVAIGYDWLYEVLPISSKNIIKESIVAKGLQPSLSNQGWLTRNNNWNQVCNAGMVYGALAVFEDFPKLSSTIINRAIESVKIPMREYRPDGAYPEGYHYWGYGTGLNVMLIDALEKSFGSSYDLKENVGFNNTANFILHNLAPSHLCFNYSDASASGNLNAVAFWFAKNNHDVSLLWNEKIWLGNEEKGNYLKDPFLPNVLIWNNGVDLNHLSVPKNLSWTGKGLIPVSFMRTSWTDTNAIYVGIKGGTASASHAHMDIGSFVMEANGERWAMDFGAENYNSIEKTGIDLWSMNQEAPRWKLFRYNNLSHNTLAFDSAFQLVEGNAPIINIIALPKAMSSEIDLSSVYANKVKSAKRKISIVKKRLVSIEDEVIGNEKEVTMRWNMLTDATVQLLDSLTAELTKNGKKLLLKGKSKGVFQVKTWSAQPSTAFESTNPGKIFVGFEVIVPANKKTTFEVKLLPENYNVK